MVGALDRLRCRQPDKFDAFFFGIADFVLRARHIGTVAAIETFDRFRALPDRGAHAIHRGIAAADDDDILALRVESPIVEIGYIIAKALAVGGDQEIERFFDSRCAHARHLDFARLVDTGCDQDRVMFIA